MLYMWYGSVLGARRKPCRKTDDGNTLWAPFSSLEVYVVAHSYTPDVDLLGESLVPIGWAVAALSAS